MIDVVLPVYNQFQLVAQCVDCLLHSDRIGTVIVVDDASTDESISELAEIRGVDYVRMPENVGFVGAVNEGMRFVSTQYAVIVNSDTTPVHNQSLRDLVYTLDGKGMYVAGPKLLFMRGSKYGREGTVQHAGVAFGRDGVPYHPFMHLHRNTAAVNIEREVSAVTGAVMAVKAEAWQSIGGFDEHFAPGVYEDVDLCLRFGGALYAPNSEWYHLMHGSQTPGNDLFDNEQDHLEKLMRRWHPKCDEAIFYGV